MPASISEYVPQLVADGESARASRRAACWAWVAVLAGAAALLGMIVGAPLARARGSLLLSQVFYEFFRPACHQMPERSFYVAGYPLAVCARCTGLYVGALAGVALYPLLRRLTRTDTPPRVWLILAAVPTTVDFALGFFRVWENTHWSRFSTALLLGAVSAFYIVPGLVDLCGMGLRRLSRRGRPGVFPEGSFPEARPEASSSRG
ncbi:MAG: DUF2085 domain-containing protein [Acidobacteriota bacterium]|nr:DUF2085 domain-containing protein [Acidobacteriota bacterium]